MNSHLVDCFLSSIAAALAVVFTQGCAGGMGWIISPPGPPVQPITVAMPYVEAVHFPAEIHAGQPFAIEFDLSCVQFPNALRSPARPFPDVDLRYNDSNGPVSLGVLPWRDITYADSGNPLTTTVSLPIHGLAAGVHRLSYYAAATREDGGKIVQMDRLSGGPADTKGPETHDMTFRVLP